MFDDRHTDRRGQVLKDKLLTLQENKGVKCCKFASLCMSLDDETRTALLSATIAPGVSVKSLQRVLAEEGHSIGATTLLDARACLTGKNSNCNKCLPELR